MISSARNAYRGYTVTVRLTRGHPYASGLAKSSPTVRWNAGMMNLVCRAVSAKITVGKALASILLRRSRNALPREVQELKEHD